MIDKKITRFSFAAARFILLSIPTHQFEPFEHH